MQDTTSTSDGDSSERQQILDLQPLEDVCGGVNHQTQLHHAPSLEHLEKTYGEQHQLPESFLPIPFWGCVCAPLLSNDGVFSPEPTTLACEDPFCLNIRPSLESSVSAPDSNENGNVVTFDRTINLPVSLQRPASCPGGPGQVQRSVQYKCNDEKCGWTFATSHALETHAVSRRHRAYFCQVPGCERGYSRRDTYVRHMTSHKRVPKTYECEICKQDNIVKAFKRKDHWVQHMRSSHLEDPLHDRPVSAPVCGTDVEDIVFALNNILGKNNATVQMIDKKLDTNIWSKRAQLAGSLATLALVEPHSLPVQTKEQLQSLKSCFENMNQPYSGRSAEVEAS